MYDNYNEENKSTKWIMKYGWIIQTIISSIALIVALVMYLNTKELLLLMQ